MNFFKKKPITDGKIVCPYCFEKAFRNDEVLFRDPADNKTYDPKDDGGNFIYSEFIDKKGKTNKVVKGYIPKGKSSSYILTERLCPYCKENIPKNLGLSESKVLAVVGSTQIGKTVFIYSLLDELNKNLANKFSNMNFSFEEPTMLAEFKQKMYEIRTGTLKPTPPGKNIKPIIVNIKNNDTNQLIVISFYDFAGESTAEQIQKISKRQIDNSAAMLILFDLTQSETMFKGVIKKQIACENNKKLDLINEVGIPSEDIEEILKLYDFNNYDNVNIESLKWNVESLREELNNAYYKKETAQENIDIARAQQNIESLSKKLNEAQSKSDEINRKKEESLSKIAEILHRQITATELNKINEIKKLDKKINRLSEDMNHYGWHYIENIDEYKPHDTPSDWVGTVFAHGIAAAVAEGSNTTTPVAVVGTKSDEIYETIIGGFSENINDNNKYLYEIFVPQLIEVPNQRQNILNLSEIDKISAFVENQLLENDGAFKSHLDTLFSDKTYFAVSALGTKYIDKEDTDENGNIKLVRELEADMKSWRVDEPLLWLLYRLGMIDGSY